jgi:hypothetical protein
MVSQTACVEETEVLKNLNSIYYVRQARAWQVFDGFINIDGCQAYEYCV